jgi:YegS/Rv2252/BmrU family lipid kinase
LKRKALFIINPISGGKKKDQVPHLIKEILDHMQFEATIVYTERAMHGSDLAKDAVDVYDYVIAVGGDGTVNEIASAIAGTNLALGIIPFGSGNGLARFLGIPMDTAKSIETINGEKVEAIDSAKLNDQRFFNLAGMGFDAHIAEVFSHDKNRGFWAYIKSSFREISRYRAETYHITIDGNEYVRDAFMLSIANSSQFGNNAHVSPHASVQDGLLDVCIIKQFPLWRFPEMGFRMFTKTADKSKYVEIIRGKNVTIKRSTDGPVHLDGEPQMMGKEVDIQMVPASLRIIVGKTLSHKL